MHPDGRLEYVDMETFGGVLDYPGMSDTSAMIDCISRDLRTHSDAPVFKCNTVSAHPVKDGDDLLFHSYSVDEEVRYVCGRLF